MRSGFEPEMIAPPHPTGCVPRNVVWQKERRSPDRPDATQLQKLAHQEIGAQVHGLRTAPLRVDETSEGKIKT
jgi:hypothetical protein